MEVSASIMDDYLSLQWNPPFTFSSILYYTVEVMIAEKKEVLCALNVSANELTYTFALSLLNINRCSNSYQLVISIFGVSFVGEGDSTNITVIVSQDTKVCPTIQGIKYI